MNRVSRFALADIFVVVGINLHAQQPSPSWATGPSCDQLVGKDFVPYHQFTADDFPVNDRVHPETAYWVRPFARPLYHFVSIQSPGGNFYLHITDWTVCSGLDKNESSRKSSARNSKQYLQSAQAILDINELYARHLAAVPLAELPSGEGKTFDEARAQLESRVTLFGEKTFNQAAKEAKEFYEATSKGREQKKVRELAAGIKKRLAALSAPTPASTASSSPMDRPTPTRSP